jgi:L-rhamnose mutarotase
MQRMGMVIGVRADKLDEYKRLHAAVWPAVLQRLSASNIRNYTIYLREPENLLFASWEYHGSDFEADIAAIAADPRTQRWWTFTDPCQEPLASRAPGEHWARLQEVFHLD